jgi:hypothetical protein
MLGYLRVFWKQQPTQEAVRARVESAASRLDHVMAAIDAAGIGRTLITGFDEASTAGKTFVPNEIVAAIAARIRTASCRSQAPTSCAARTRCATSSSGASPRLPRPVAPPFMIGLPADDRHYYPFYAKCVELGVPLSIHTSANWTTGAINDLGHPRHLDPVARDFPELRIIMSHAGYPWVLEAVLLAGSTSTSTSSSPRTGRATWRSREPAGSPPSLRPVDDRRQGVVRHRVVPPRTAAGDDPRGVPRAARQAAVMERWLSGNAERLLSR